MTFIDFHGRRAALEVQIADVQERQGAALLDGRPFDASGLADLQASRDALCKFDRVIVVAWDESWIAETIVAHADRAKVVLTKPRLLSLPDRYEALFQ